MTELEVESMAKKLELPQVQLRKELNVYDAIRYLFVNNLETTITSSTNDQHYIESLTDKDSNVLQVKQFTSQDDIFEIVKQIEVDVSTILTHILCTGMAKFDNLMSGIRENTSIQKIIERSKYAKDKESEYYFIDEHTQKLTKLYDRDQAMRILNKKKKK